VGGNVPTHAQVLERVQQLAQGQAAPEEEWVIHV
jgi:hypothetical protein